MLSIALKLMTPIAAGEVSSMSITCSGFFARNSIPARLRPQNVQWCFMPHQQPRAVSIGSSTSPSRTVLAYPLSVRA